MISRDIAIDPSVRIGRATSIGPGSVIESDVELGENVVIGADVIIGSRATISAGIAVKTGARVLPGAIVTSSVAARAIVDGDPATTIGFADAVTWPGDSVDLPHTPGDFVPIGLDGCAATVLKDVRDSRGSLLPIELTHDLPFLARRLFFVHDVAEGGVRGQHAHRSCDQLLFAIAGEVTVVLDDGSAAVEIRLERSNLGIYLPAGVWVTHYQFSKNAVLAVLAELPYDPNETIGDYDDYLVWRANVAGSEA